MSILTTLHLFLASPYHQLSASGPFHQHAFLHPPLAPALQNKNANSKKWHSLYLHKIRIHTRIDAFIELYCRKFLLLCNDRLEVFF